MTILFDVALPLGGGTGVGLCLVGTQSLPLLGQAIPVPKVVLHVCLWGHTAWLWATLSALLLPPSCPSPFWAQAGPDQNHVSRGDVHVGLGRLLAPGRGAAVGAGAGLGRITELGGHTAHPRRLWWALCPVEQGLCGHVLAAQVLQRKDSEGCKGCLELFNKVLGSILDP